MSNSLATKWVVGAYEGDLAKTVLAHAEHGIGYFILEQGGSRTNPAVMVAFLISSNQRLGQNCTVIIDERKIDDLEARRNARTGTRDRTPKPIQSIKNMMGMRN